MGRCFLFLPVNKGVMKGQPGDAKDQRKMWGMDHTEIRIIKGLKSEPQFCIENYLWGTISFIGELWHS